MQILLQLEHGLKRFHMRVEIIKILFGDVDMLVAGRDFCFGVFGG